MRLEKLDALIREIEETPDNEDRQRIYRSVAPVIDLHREALARMIEIARQRGGASILSAFLEDPLLEPLLRGYGLDEDPSGAELRTRVEAALEHARPLLQAHGGDVTLLGVDSGLARVELHGACHGCGSSRITLKNVVENVLRTEVPELRGVEVGGASEREPALHWVPLVHWSELHEGEWMKMDLFDEQILVCTIDQRPFAFRNRCPAGGGGLESAGFDHLSIVCGCHSLRFDLRSGACTERPDLGLDIFPVMLEDAVVRIALRGELVS
jgi:Fe-S cluster biogenesis protein NfuA/nitrite reductase/ring-hydroxylating ferredoxin subunit